MQAETKHRQNLLGAGGWFWAGNYKMERYLYTLHRVTGLGILLFAMFHMVETTIFRMQGQTMWQITTGFLKQPLFEVGLVLVSFAFVIHAVNGLRLILQEFGYTLGKARRPVFPYQDALRRKRTFTMMIIVVIVILVIIFLLNVFTGGK